MSKKYALVTGSSSGFGKEISLSLIEDGYIVYGIARRKYLLEATFRGVKNFIPIALDIADKESVKKWYKENAYIRFNILVNNAGIALGSDKFHKLDWADIETVINTNILGLAHLTWLYCNDLENIQDPYIINIGSVAGSYSYPNSNIYGASKAFVSMLSSNLRSDYHDIKLRVTTIEPGLARTEFTLKRFKGNSKAENTLYEGIDHLKAKDIASVIKYLVSLPPDINISQVEIVPTAQANGPFLFS